MITIGTMVGTHGVRGVIKVRPTGLFPERFRQLKQVTLVAPGKAPEVFPVNGVKMVPPIVHLMLQGIDSLETAKLYKSSLIQVPDTEAYDLPEGYYYHHQLIGLSVIDQKRGELGPLKEILETGAHDVYVVEGANKDYLLPAIPQVIHNIDLERGTMLVEMLPGLEDI